MKKVHSIYEEILPGDSLKSGAYKTTTHVYFAWLMF